MLAAEALPQRRGMAGDRIEKNDQILLTIGRRSRYIQLYLRASTTAQNANRASAHSTRRMLELTQYKARVRPFRSVCLQEFVLGGLCAEERAESGKPSTGGCTATVAGTKGTGPFLRLRLYLGAGGPHVPHSSTYRCLTDPSCCLGVSPRGQDGTVATHSNCRRPACQGVRHAGCSVSSRCRGKQVTARCRRTATRHRQVFGPRVLQAEKCQTDRQAAEQVHHANRPTRSQVRARPDPGEGRYRDDGSADERLVRLAGPSAGSRKHERGGAV